jgi:hypothetical protein
MAKARVWVKIGKKSSDWYPSIKNQKQFKITVKMLRIFSGSMGSGSKLGLHGFWVQQQFLNKKNTPQLKSPNTEVRPVPSADILIRFSTGSGIRDG